MSFKENPPRSGSAVLEFMVKNEDEVFAVIAVQMFVCVFQVFQTPETAKQTLS